MNALQSVLPIDPTTPTSLLPPDATLPAVVPVRTLARPGGVWTDERVELLKKLWADGLSAAHIAREIGGITRNAVIGKVHRMGLGKRLIDTQHPSRKGTRGVRAKRRVVHLPQADGSVLERFEPYVPDTLPPPDPQFMCTMDDLGPLQSERAAETVRCRAPIGDPGADGFRYCGTPGAELPGPYCPFHYRLFYQQGSASAKRAPQRVRLDSGDTDRGRALARLDYTDSDGAGAVPPLLLGNDD